MATGHREMLILGPECKRAAGYSQAGSECCKTQSHCVRVRALQGLEREVKWGEAAVREGCSQEEETPLGLSLA